MRRRTLTHAFAHNFLGHSPRWYKASIICFLLINPIILMKLGPFITGWIIIAQFIFTLAMALKCYPLQPGGLIAIQCLILGLTTTENVYLETIANFKVILLLMFMVAGIYFMKDILLLVFSKILLSIRSKVILSFLFCSISAVLSAFLDALTVIAVLITVASGFYNVYHKVHSSKNNDGQDHTKQDKQTLSAFRRFLSNLMMHGAVGTALGGVCTLVGEPQNLLIAERAGWDFISFFIIMLPVTFPVLIAGLITCILLETFKFFGYGAELPNEVRQVLQEYNDQKSKQRSKEQEAKLIIQAIAALLLVISLISHVAEVGLIGLGIVVLLTTFNGIVDESRIGHAFEEALPFTALLIVFFVIVAVIHDQHLFKPIIDLIFAQDTSIQPTLFFIANGILSMISDNVFVATVYIEQATDAFKAGHITQDTYNKLAVAINAGTNIPSVATPNGQAAFLFLLTSALAPLLRLSYARMVWMALPYTIVMSTVGLLAVINLL
jgi:Na+:H+ antiporter, NhaB family